MGPPLSRVLVNKKPRSSTGSANSVASSGGALSDGFVYGGSLLDDAASSVVAEMASVQSTEELSTAEYVYLTIRDDSENNNNNNAVRQMGELDCSMELQMKAISLHMRKEMEVPQISEVASLKDMSQNSGSGRVSPGGTVYKGRGIRRYQGRYMHLPLKRFHQNSTCNSQQYPSRADIELNSYRDSEVQKIQKCSTDNEKTRGQHWQERECMIPTGIRRASKSRSWSRSRSRSPENCHSFWSKKERSRSRSQSKQNQDCHYNRPYNHHSHWGHGERVEKRERNEDHPASAQISRNR